MIKYVCIANIFASQKMFCLGIFSQHFSMFNGYNNLFWIHVRSICASESKGGGAIQHRKVIPITLVKILITVRKQNNSDEPATIGWISAQLNCFCSVSDEKISNIDPRSRKIRLRYIIVKWRWLMWAVYFYENHPLSEVSYDCVECKILFQVFFASLGK